MTRPLNVLGILNGWQIYDNGTIRTYTAPHVVTQEEINARWRRYILANPPEWWNRPEISDEFRRRYLEMGPGPDIRRRSRRWTPRQLRQLEIIRARQEDDLRTPYIGPAM
jgi:hypothetical protein